MIMKSIFKSAFVVFSLATLFNTVSAADLIGTANSAGGQTVLEIGFANDGPDQVSGVQFDIKLDPKAAATFENADLSSCLSALPKAFSASSCTVIDDATLRVIVLSMSGQIVPSTVLGTIKLPAASRRALLAAAPGASAIKFENVVMGDSTGAKIEPGLVDFSSKISTRDGSKRQILRPGN